jgi:hypothetical protein
MSSTKKLRSRSDRRKATITSPKWTILIYQAGDNNLAEECVYALKEIKSVGTQSSANAAKKAPAQVSIVAQFDPSGRGNPTRRFKISGPGRHGSIEDNITERLPETDTGAPGVLLDFLCKSIKENRSDFYMVILSGHGAGFSEGFFLEDDERPLSSIPSSFPIPALRDVFKSDRLKQALAGKKINILGFDSCMMSTVEVTYQLRTVRILDLVIASEGFALNSGWIFPQMLDKLKSEADIAPAALADFIVKDYVTFYYDYHLGGMSVDQSIIKLSRIGDLRRAIDRLARALIREFNRESPGKNKEFSESGKPFQDAILLAHWAAQSYGGESCVDLYDFCDLLQQRWRKHENRNNAGSVAACCERVKAVIAEGDKRLIQSSCFSGAAAQYSRGVSLYFPWSESDYAPSYGNLDFAADSAWPKFLATYLKATKRPPRDERIKSAKPSQPAADTEVRATPPANRGSGGKIHSMRNPPSTFPLSDCLRKEDEPTKARE